MRTSQGFWLRVKPSSTDPLTSWLASTLRNDLERVFRTVRHDLETLLELELGS